MYKKRGVGTWRRRNLSGTVSVTWRSVPGGCRRRARLVLTAVPVGPGLCWLFGLSGRPWTLLALPAPVGPGRCRLFLFRGERKEGERKRDGRGSLARGGNGPGRKGRKRESRASQWEGMGQGNGESGKAGVPSQWEGTGQENGESGFSARSEAESESVLELD
jgi:hypothetical protein